MRYEINKKSNGPLYITEEDLIKQNANCPASEKSGTGPGSCGGASGKGQNPKEVLKKTDEAKALIDKVNKSKSLSKGTSDIHLSEKIQNSATDDFANNMGEKPDDSEILQRGMDIADASGIKGDKAQMDFAEKYSAEYDKAWESAVSDAKSHGFESDQPSSKSSSSQLKGTPKGLRDAHASGLISGMGRVKKDFTTSSGKSYKKGEYVTRHYDGDWDDEGQWAKKSKK